MGDTAERGNWGAVRPGEVAKPIDTDRFRHVMRSFATGVAVVTAHHQGADFGMTVNALTSVSLDPPLILVCLARGTATLDAVENCGRFGISILDESQQAYSLRFSLPVKDRFAGVAVERDEFGLPLIADSIAYLRCSVENSLEGGDHRIVVGRVEDADARSGRGLIFYGGGYPRLLAES